jgi:hypothetical protein
MGLKFHNKRVLTEFLLTFISLIIFPLLTLYLNLNFIMPYLIESYDI